MIAHDWLALALQYTMQVLTLALVLAIALRLSGRD